MHGAKLIVPPDEMCHGGIGEDLREVGSGMVFQAVPSPLDNLLSIAWGLLTVGTTE